MFSIKILFTISVDQNMYQKCCFINIKYKLYERQWIDTITIWYSQLLFPIQVDLSVLFVYNAIKQIEALTKTIIFVYLSIDKCP